MKITNARGRASVLPLTIAVATAFIVAFLLLGSGNAIPHLRVVSESGDILLDVPLGEKSRWAVVWNHSVTGILVSDYYRFEGGKVLLSATHTPAFDAGLGHIPGRGRLEDDGQGGYWIRDIDEPVVGNAYLLRVGSMRVNHRIEHAGNSYSLSRLAAGERVRVEVVE